MPYAFTPGWKRQTRDPRDYHFKVPNRILAVLADFLSLAANSGPRLNQGNLGSCGPNTGDECITYEQKVEQLPVTYASRLFMYWNTRWMMGTVSQDSGVDNRTMMKALNQYGFCPESMWPYSDDQTTFTRQPTKACYTAAKPNCIQNYAAVYQTLEQMKGCLSTGHPFILGFDVFPQLLSDEAAETGIIAMPSGSAEGGHDVSCFGFSDKDRPGFKKGNTWPAGHFLIRNHWEKEPGVPWGDDGWGYMPYDYTIGKNASDFWVMNALPGGKPVVPPTPDPTPVPVPVGVIGGRWTLDLKAGSGNLIMSV